MTDRMMGGFFKRRGIAVAALANSLAIAGLILAQQVGLLPPGNDGLSVLQWFIYASVFATTGGQWFLIHTMFEKAYQRSQLEMRERDRVEADLRKLTLAVEQSPVSVVIADLEGNIQYANPTFSQITGYGLGEVLGQNPRILKTDLTAPGTHQELWDALLDGKVWRGEFVNRKKDGSYYYESASISPVKDRGGQVTHYLAVKEDITERKRAETALSASEAKYRIVADNTYGWEFWSDPAGKYIYISPACKMVCGYEAGELMADLTLAPKMIHPEDRLIMERHNELIKTQVKDEIDFRIIHKDGSLRWIGHTCVPIFDDQGVYLGNRGSNQDITSRKLAEEKLAQANEQLSIQLALVNDLKDRLQEQAVRDPLTGLYNRRYLSETLPRELIRAERERGCVSLLIADVDHFKDTNDSSGHQAGDEVLKAFGQLFTSSLRGSDIACRYGGEEFLLVLPGASLENAVKRAEEIRQKCAEAAVEYGGRKLQATISVGVACYPQHAQTADEILSRADQALYQSKWAGRNRVTTWDAVQPERIDSGAGPQGSQ